jgi:cellulose biosynthesis protein BcsQ
MATVISLFNHKGGVSKTTTTFNLGWSLAELGLKTLIVDADPQCNLTSYCLGLDSQKELDLFYEKRDSDNVFTAIKHIISPTIADNANVRGVKPTDTLHPNLKLAAGNLELTDLDIFCAVGLASDNRYNAHATKFVGLFSAMIRETARLESFDVVLVDMSPSSGALNRSILMGSDYFIVPTYPEFFCFQAIEYLARQLPFWSDDFAKYRDPKVPNCLPKENPKMMGIICQNYRPHKNETQDKVKATQKWVDKIQDASNSILAKSLVSKNMVISEELFRKSTEDKKLYNLINIPNFNSLVLASQEYSKPVFELTKAEIGQQGAVLEQAQGNQEIFKSLFKEFAIEIIKIANLPQELISDKVIFNALVKKASKPVQQ